MERDQRKRKAEEKSAKAKSMKIVEAIKVSISSLVPTSLFHAYLPHATLCVCVCVAERITTPHSSSGIS